MIPNPDIKLFKPYFKDLYYLLLLHILYLYNIQYTGDRVSKERLEDSKVVAKKITIGREITKKEMIEIFNKKVNLEKENNNNN
jgi:hypothetical protein